MADDNAVAITKRVSKRVTHLTVTMSQDKSDLEHLDYSIIGDWKIPESMTSTNREDRAEWVDAIVWFNGTNKGKNRWATWGTKSPPEVWYTGPGSSDPGGDYRDAHGNLVSPHDLLWTNADCFWIKGLVLNTGVTKPFDRGRYHPLNENAIVNEIAFGVQGGSTKEAFRGDWQFAYLKIDPPLPPEDISEIQFDASHLRGYVSMTLPKSTPYRERWCTRWIVYREDNIPGSAYKNKKSKIHSAHFYEDQSDDTNIETKSSSQYGDVYVAGATGLAVGQWIRMTVHIWTEGMGGTSDDYVDVVKVFSHPPKGKITDISIAEDQIRVGFNTNVGYDPNKVSYAQDIYPIDTVKLQELPNDTSISTLADADASNDWADVQGAEAYGSATGFTIPTSGHTPNRGKHKYFRIVSIHDSYETISKAAEAKALYKPKQAQTSDTVAITNVSATEDADGIYVNLGWNNDQSEYTEVYYSEYRDAMSSNKKPQPIVVDWKDATSQSQTYANTAQLTIYDVAEGVDYYIWACRYKKDAETGEDIRGKMATPVQAKFPFRPASKPSDVVLFAPDYIEKGKDFDVNWTYVAGSDQTAWNLNRISGTNRTIILSGKDSIGSTKVAKSYIPKNATSITLSVSITTGGDWTESDPKTVSIAQSPVIDAKVTSPLRQQPMSVNLQSNTGTDSVVIKVFSKGITVEHPAKTIQQLDGDVVWSGYVTPAWVLDNSTGKYNANVVLPDNLELYQNGYYTLEVTGVDNNTGMVSSTKVTEFRIDYWHTAKAPKRNSIVLEDQDAKTVRIKPIPPNGYNDTDRVDIYRVTPESVDLVVSDVVYGSIVTDKYPPYSKIVPTYYRLAHRTSDGDIDWVDIPYRIAWYATRFDWSGNRFLEVPYNLTISDKYSKDFEYRQHMDGSSGGAWNANVKSTASISTQLIKLSDPEQQDLVRELGKYPGAVFVRTPNGLAYEADVQVDKLDWSYDKLVMSVSFSITKFDLTDEFRVSSTDVKAPVDENNSNYMEYTELLRWNSTIPAEGEQFTLTYAPVELTVVTVTVASSVDDFLSGHETFAHISSGNVIQLNPFDEEFQEWLDSVSSTSGVRYMINVRYTYDASA